MAMLERTSCLSRAAAVSALLGIAVLCLARNLDRPLTGDSVRYANIARVMVESGDWATPHHMGVPYFRKPPLAFWATAASLSTFGISPSSAMLPSILAGILLVVVVFLLVERLAGHVAGWAAALGLLFTTGFANNTITCRLESQLLLWMTLFLCAIEAARSHKGWFLAAWACLGAAVMTKGPPGLLPLGLVVLRGAFKDHFPLDRRAFWASFPVFLLVVGPWYAHMTATFGREFWASHVGHEILDRAGASERASTLGVLWVSARYAGVMLAVALPGALLALAPRQTDLRIRRAATLGALWILVVFTSQAFNRVAYSRYAYMSLVACAGLSGYAVDRAVSLLPKGRDAEFLVRASFAVGFGTLVVLAGLRVAGIEIRMGTKDAAPHIGVLLAVAREVPEGPILAVTIEPEEVEHFVHFHLGRSSTHVDVDDLATKDEELRGAAVLVDGRGRDAARARGATPIAEGFVFSLVRWPTEPAPSQPPPR